MAKGDYSIYRKFDGHRYVLVDEFGKKSDAIKRAENARSRGHSARVVELPRAPYKGKSYRFWGVYIRKN